MTIIRIGLDTSKHVFQVHGVDEHEQAVLCRRLQRSQVEKFFVKLAPARIGLEACGAAHHWARVLRGLGHEVVLLPPQYIKPYVKRSKNDAIGACPRASPWPDPWAAAICEAMSRPGMRFVPVKSVEGLQRPGARRLGKMHAGLEPGHFTSPHGIAVDQHGNIFVGELSGRSWGRFTKGPPPKRIRVLHKLEKLAG